MTEANERAKARKRERRNTWIASHGGCCAMCGSTSHLEIDHIDRSTKTCNVDALWLCSPDNPRLLAELAKCQVLCRTCHRAKTNAEMLSAEHGTLTRYQYGCRCLSCTRANTKRQRQYWRDKGRPARKPAQHGSPGMYNTRKCKCDVCRAAKAKYQRQYTARKKAEKEGTSWT